MLVIFKLFSVFYLFRDCCYVAHHEIIKSVSHPSKLGGGIKHLIGHTALKVVMNQSSCSDGRTPLMHTQTWLVFLKVQQLLQLSVCMSETVIYISFILFKLLGKLNK